ncbi:hypothetical protein GCM10022419_096520 [Nonomuraea rosea]|uniref:DUF3040 domain-containing protein n=1 Tax=Nonomuraea rosea TaxID=638574 RepID=A0ABP6Z631_9ACTN
MRDHTGSGADRPSPEIEIPISLSRIRIKFFAFAGLTAGCAIFGATGWLTLTLLLTCVGILLAVAIIGGRELTHALFFGSPADGSR